MYVVYPVDDNYPCFLVEGKKEMDNQNYLWEIRRITSPLIIRESLCNKCLTAATTSFSCLLLDCGVYLIAFTVAEPRSSSPKTRMRASIVALASEFFPVETWIILKLVLPYDAAA